MEILKPDGNTSYTVTTEGLNELLFREHINFSKVTEDDVIDYFTIFQELLYNPGQSKRVKEIREKFPDISLRYSANSFKNLNVKRVKEYPGSGLSCKATPSKSSCNEIPVDLTNNNPLQLYQELSLLLAAKQAGNKNTLGKASIILDHFKNNKSINPYVIEIYSSEVFDKISILLH